MLRLSYWIKMPQIEDAIALQNPPQRKSCMTNEESRNAPPVAGFRWLTAGASLAVGAAFFSLWFWLLPRWLGFTVDMAGVARWRWLAAVPSVLGFAVALRCIWDFGWTGLGTPAPIAPPAAGGSGFLSLCAKPHVRGVCDGMDRTVDSLRARQRRGDRRSRRRCPRRAFVRALL